MHFDDLEDENLGLYPGWIRRSVYAGAFILGFAFWAGVVELVFYLTN